MEHPRRASAIAVARPIPPLSTLIRILKVILKLTYEEPVINANFPWRDSIGDSVAIWILG